MTNISHTRFRLVPKSTTLEGLDDVEGPLRTLFQNTCVPTTKIWMKKQDYTVSDDDIAQWQYKVYADVRSDSQDLCKFSWFMPTPLYYVYTYLTLFFVIKFNFNCYCLLQFSTNGCSGKVKCGLAEMWQGKRISVMSSAEYLESAEKQRIFRRRYIVGILTNKANISI